LPHLFYSRMSKPTDIQIVDAVLRFESVPFRTPLKFGGRLVESGPRASGDGHGRTEARLEIEEPENRLASRKDLGPSHRDREGL